MRTHPKPAEWVMKEFENKIVLITGATTGIGFAAAKKFVEQGARVIGTGRGGKSLEVAKSELPQVDWKASDVGDPAAIESLFAGVKSEYGKLDVLYLNAGIARFAPWAEGSLSEFEDHFNVNVRGPWLAIQKALPLLGKGSSIVVTGSVVDRKGFAGTSIYSATKAAVRSMVRVAAAEFSSLGIRINVVSPGPIDTPIFDKGGMPKEESDGMKVGFASMVPLQRMGTSEEAANVALFLASERASYVTGTEICVDGGIAQV